jgi:hypothetical protein
VSCCCCCRYCCRRPLREALQLFLACSIPHVPVATTAHKHPPSVRAACVPEPLRTAAAAHLGTERRADRRRGVGLARLQLQLDFTGHCNIQKERTQTELATSCALTLHTRRPSPRAAGANGSPFAALVITSVFRRDVMRGRCVLKARLLLIRDAMVAAASPLHTTGSLFALSGDAMRATIDAGVNGTTERPPTVMAVNGTLAASASIEAKANAYNSWSKVSPLV